MHFPTKRKKRACTGSILMALILISTCIFSCSGPDDKTQTRMENEHAMGSVWAMVYPTDLVLRLADHTYVSGRDSDGNTYDWLCFGKGTGGEELPGTATEDSADITAVGFMASQAPCKWPLEYYLRIGVCHQCANRALYYTGKTVADSEGYDFFASLYGTYGDESAAEHSNYSMQNCIDAAPQWQGTVTAGAQRNFSVAKADNFNSGMEAQLYREYLQKKSTHTVETNQHDPYGQYLDRLFETRIRTKLGDDFPVHAIADLLDARNRYRREKIAIDQKPLPDNGSAEDLKDRYRRLFNDLADAYRMILTPHEYETLFVLDYANEIELDSILPK